MPINVIKEIVNNIAINWRIFSRSKKKMGIRRLAKIAMTGAIPPKVGTSLGSILCTSLLVYPLVIRNLFM